MTSDENAAIREWARKLADDAPELNDQQWQHLGRLLRPATDTDAAEAPTSRRASTADEWVAQHIARTQAEEFGVDDAGLFAIDLPRQRTRDAR